MVNEERLRHMIKMAEFDKNQGKKCRPMIQYARKDYISLHLLVSFVTGSMCYALLVGTAVLYSTESFLARLNQMDIQGMLMSLLVPYLLLLILYLGATYIVYYIKYTVGRRRVKQYYTHVRKVNQMYEREERLRVSDEKGWE